jgi:arylsulfatase A-like enzyme
LEQRGLLENTIVIITSDHGESLGEHGLLQHSASLYLQEIHVPLIIWGPGLVPAGTVIDSPVSLVGLPVTIMELLHANDGTFPGRSLTMLFEETTARAWPQPIAELAHLPGAAEINPSTHGALKSVVGDEMQYIVHEKFGEELYDWRSDPEETKNLISEPSSRSVAENFRRYLENLIGELFNP